MDRYIFLKVDGNISRVKTELLIELFQTLGEILRKAGFGIGGIQVRSGIGLKEIEG